MSWTLAPSLARLLDEVNRRWPNRDKRSDGTIGDRAHGWKGRKYNGSNPHAGHIHISIRNGTSERASAALRAHAARDTSSWGIAPTGPMPPKTGVSAPKPSPRTLKRGTVGDDVKRLQTELLRIFPAYAKRITANGGPTTNFGPATEAVVREFQRRHGKGLVVDGIVGPKTRTALASYGVRL